MTFGGGEAFRQVFAEKSGCEKRARGEKTRGDGGSLGQNNGAEGRLMEVLVNVIPGKKCVDVVRSRGDWRDGYQGGLLDALEVHVIESVGGVASDLQGGGRAK